MSTLARNEQREQLRYTFSPSEREEKGRQLADSLNRQSAEALNLKRITKDFNAKIATIESEVSALKDAVLSGYELREYVCFFEYDTPEKGKKTLRRKEPPCDIVRVEEMTEADRQTVMESIEAQVADGATEESTSLVVLPGAAPKPVQQPAANASEDDELAWAAQLEAQRKQTATENAEKKKAAKGKGRKTSSGGVVATEADGPEITTEDDKKNSN